MPKPSERVALSKELQKAIEKAAKPTLAKVGEVLAEGCSYDDERDRILIILADGGITSAKYPLEQKQALAERDSKRAAHQNGMSARKVAEAKMRSPDALPDINDAGRDWNGTDGRDLGARQNPDQRERAVDPKRSGEYRDE